MGNVIDCQAAALQCREMVGKKYRHFKDGLYIVTDIAVHTESEDIMVVYKDVSNPSLVWARPLALFLSKVDKDKYPEAAQEYRFEEVLV